MGGRSMHGSLRLLALSLVVVVGLALFAVSVAPRVTPGFSDVGRVTRWAPTLPFSPTSRYVDPALTDATGRVDVVVALQASASAEGISQYLSGARAMPLIDDVRLVRGLVEASKIGEIQSSPGVLAILKDRPIGFDSPKKPDMPLRLPVQFKDLRNVEPAAIERESLTGDAELTMRDVVNFTGARRAWTELGVDGTSVTIAIVDTGVDFGAFNLGNSAVARNTAGVPISFDPDGSTFAWTTIEVSRYSAGPQDFVETFDTDPLIYVWDYAGVLGGGPVALLWSDLFLGTFPEDMEVTGLPPSISGVYRFGVLREWAFTYFDLFPILLIDTTTSGVYDRAYVDLDLDWFLFGLGAAPDWSFSNETALVPAGGNAVAARDMDGDGYVDISAGSLAWALDIWGLDPTPPPAGPSYLAPIDADGEYITMVYDWESHGTSVAASAAGRESNHPLAGPGTGPGAKIMGVPIFAWFDILEGWLWAAGFDLVGPAAPRFVPNYGGVYGEWTYTGNHKADIISNSWGSSEWLLVSTTFGWPWYDVLTVVEDALMTPGYAAPSYPGTLMVHAGGNGASGYGTVTEPGWNSLALTVGASTNLGYTSLPYGGTHYDVISWSARGPNLFGYPKPDLLQVGAFAFAASPVWWGFGDGFSAFTLFGGTSQATPVTSGSAAVLIEAYRTSHGGASPTPFQVKSILKSTALDLGYDPFVQGAGHVDVYNAAAYALGNSGLLTTSPASWDNVRPWVSGPWSSASVFYGAEIGANPPAGPIGDTSWFAGAVKPGAATSASFTTTPATGSVSGTIAAVSHIRMPTSIVRTGTTALLPGAPGSWLEGVGAFEVLLSTDIPVTADLMVVRAGMPYSFLDADGNYTWDNRSRIVVADWVDSGNGIIEPAEISVFNYGYNTGTTVEARVGLPSGRFAGVPLLWFNHVPAPGRTFVPMPYRIDVEFYDRQTWSWVSAPNSFTAPATWTATLTVPSGTAPGVYEGQIIVTPTNGNATAVPVSVVVPATIDPEILSLSLTSSGSTQIYDPSTMLGYFDWRWRYEAGDWKLWFVDVVDPTTVALYAEVSWTGVNSDVDIFSIAPSSIPNDSSFSPYLGSGIFIQGTRTGTTKDWVVATTQTGLGLANPGLYTFALHNVLLGNGGAPATPESLRGTVAAAKLSPRGPVTVETQPGSIVSIPFTFSTGYNLSDVLPVALPQPASSFPSTASPASPSFLLADESMTIWLNITVPAATPDGPYQNFMLLVASPFPGAIVPVNVVVTADVTAPTVSFASPPANAWVRGTITVSFSVSDPNLDVATLTYGGTSVDVTGMTSASVNTATLADGDQTLTLTARDQAGNSRSATLTVKVDNTRPTAVLRSPASGTFLSGSVGFSFIASDANVKTANLTIGTQVIDVRGVSTATVNTATLADGTSSVTLAVSDLAGNTASDTMSVTVDNTDPAVTISSPQANTNLRGTATIEWAVNEANVGQAWLIIDGVRRDVTGAATFSWDTTKVGDGAHTIEVEVVDDAGNVGSATRTVTTDNVAALVSTERGTSFSTGLTIGLAVAAVVASVLGFLLGRSRKRGPESASMPTGPGEPPPPKPPQDEL